MLMHEKPCLIPVLTHVQDAVNTHALRMLDGTIALNAAQVLHIMPQS